jgi:putative DNA primase/helicase
MYSAGKTFDEFVAACYAHPDLSEWTREKGQLYNNRELHKIWTKAEEDFARNVIDPRAPYTVARRFIDQHFTYDGRPTLHHHRGGFYQWSGCAYREAGADELRAQLYGFLDKCTAKDARSGLTLPVTPNATMVSHLLDALAAAAHLDGLVAAPAWLGEVTDPPASELVVCANGLLHLPTLRLMPLTPDFFTVNALDFAYDPEAATPRQWLAFLRQLWPADAEAIATLQEMFGYCLTAETRQQKAFLLIGPKRSGKGTIARVLGHLVGLDNCVAPTLAGLGTNFGLAPLIGKRVAIVSDARLSGRADQQAIGERLLAITGEDRVTIDRKDGSAWTGQLQARFVVMSNELPRLADASGALASRFVVLVLTKSFFGQEDPKLTDRLLTELPGVLNWAIEGWRRLTARGYFVQPRSADDAVQQLEDLSSPIGAFLRECCEIGALCSAGKDELYAVWCTWCTEQEGRDYPGTKATFFRDLLAAVPWLKPIRPRRGDDRWRGYQGIGLK